MVHTKPLLLREKMGRNFLWSSRPWRLALFILALKSLIWMHSFSHSNTFQGQRNIFIVLLVLIYLKTTPCGWLSALAAARRSASSSRRRRMKAATSRCGRREKSPSSAGL